MEPPQMLDEMISSKESISPGPFASWEPTCEKSDASVSALVSTEFGATGKCFCAGWCRAGEAAAGKCMC